MEGCAARLKRDGGLREVYGAYGRATSTSNAMGHDVAAVPPVAPTPTIAQMFGAQGTRWLVRYTWNAPTGTLAMLVRSSHY
jgi:hypothetical protein